MKFIAASITIPAINYSGHKNQLSSLLKRPRFLPRSVFERRFSGKANRRSFKPGKPGRGVDEIQPDNETPA
jgi:hypothetical protein